MAKKCKYNASLNKFYYYDENINTDVYYDPKSDKFYFDGDDGKKWYFNESRNTYCSEHTKVDITAIKQNKDKIKTKLAIQSGKDIVNTTMTSVGECDNAYKNVLKAAVLQIKGKKDFENFKRYSKRVEPKQNESEEELKCRYINAINYNTELLQTITERQLKEQSAGCIVM